MSPTLIHYHMDHLASSCFSVTSNSNTKKEILLSPSSIYLIVQFQYGCILVSELLICTLEGSIFIDYSTYYVQFLSLLFIQTPPISKVTEVSTFSPHPFQRGWFICLSYSQILSSHSIPGFSDLLNVLGIVYQIYNLGAKGALCYWYIIISRPIQ